VDFTLEQPRLQATGGRQREQQVNGGAGDDRIYPMELNRGGAGWFSRRRGWRPAAWPRGVDRGGGGRGTHWIHMQTSGGAEGEQQAEQKGRSRRPEVAAPVDGGRRSSPRRRARAHLDMHRRGVGVTTGYLSAGKRFGLARVDWLPRAVAVLT
jgi:hypothetical protein